MSQTLSFDASLKLKGSDIKGFVKHFLREDDEQRQHSNECIDRSRTHANMTLVYDTQTGRMTATRSADDIITAVNSRLADAIDLSAGTYKNTGKKVRKDAVQARGLVVQLDPEFYKQSNTSSAMKSYNDLLHVVQNQYGRENIVAASVHLDETNPHMHLLMVPVTHDGRLSQAEFFDKKKLKTAHKEMREELRSKGYDIDLNRRTPEGAHRLTEQEYKDLQESVSRKEKLDGFELSLRKRAKQLDADREQLTADQEQLDADKASFEAYKERTEQELVLQRQQVLRGVEQLYDKSLKLHNKLLAHDDAYLKYAQDYGNELGSIKREMSDFSL